MIIFDFFDDKNTLTEKATNPMAPDGDDITRGRIHLTLIDRHRDTNMPVRLEFSDGAAYRMVRPQDKEWFLNIYDSYAEQGKENEFFKSLGNHQGFVKLLELYTMDKAREMHRKITSAPKKKTTASYRKQTDSLDEQQSSSVRTRRMLDRMRMQFPQAGTDLEAILFSLDDTKKSTRREIDNLEQEIDQAEGDLKQDLENKLKDIGSQRSRMSDRMGQIQASDQEQQGVIDRIISIDQAQQQALDDLENLVKKTKSAPSVRAAKQLDTLTKRTSKPKSTDVKVQKSPEPVVEPATADDEQDQKYPRLVSSNGRAVAGRPSVKQQVLRLVDPDQPEELERVAETQARPKLRRIHYFRVGAAESDNARSAGLSQDRGGNWVLLQFDTSGRGFDQKFTQAVRLFGRPTRSDNVDEFSESKSQSKKVPPPRNPVAKHAPRSGAGAHRNKKQEAKRGIEKHPKADMNERAQMQPDSNYRGVYQGLAQLQSLGHEPSEQKNNIEKSVISQIQALVKQSQDSAGAPPLSEGLMPGEYYNWTVEFDDGSKEIIAVATDEYEYAKDAAERKFSGKNIAKLSSDFAIQGTGGTGGYMGADPALRSYHGRAAGTTEPLGRPVDNPMVKEGWKSVGTKTSGNLKVKIYKDTTWGKYAIEFFRDGEYLPNETYRAEDADEAKEVIKNFLRFQDAAPMSEIGVRGLGEAKKKPVPTNADLWSRAKSAARSKFDVYPSAYANAWAAKWYKAKGGGWRMGEPKNEDMETLHEVEAKYIGDYTYVKHSPESGWTQYHRGEPTGKEFSDQQLPGFKNDKTSQNDHNKGSTK